MRMKRRVVGAISNYQQPRQIYELVVSRTRTYQQEREMLEARDRALCAACLVSGGRISPIVGDFKYKVMNDKPVKVGKYDGLCRHNLTIKPDYILTSGAEVGKRTDEILQKYGQQAGTREDFIFPLKAGVWPDKPAFDQLIPFGWLLLEYVLNWAPQNQDELFPMSRTWAYKIISEITGEFPNWFRAQAEHFYGNYIFKDTVMLARFMKVVRPEQVGHYIRFDWKAALPLETEWIERTVAEIKSRIRSFPSEIQQQA